MALAAEPAANVRERANAMATILLPIGLLAAVALVVAILYLARSQLAMPAMIKAALRRGVLHRLPAHRGTGDGSLSAPRRR